MKGDILKIDNIWKSDLVEYEKSEYKKIISQIGEALGDIQDRILDLGLEDRPEQNDIMWDIIDALESKKNYLIEAGVGIGKSYAYLIPGILLSRYTGEPLIVATSSIHLTEQLANDIKNVEKILEVQLNSEKIEVVVGKGRKNYPCTHKINLLIQNCNDNKNEKLKLIYEEILEKVKMGADKQNHMGIEEKYWKEITEHTCERDLSFKNANCPLHKMRNNLKLTQEMSYSLSKNRVHLYKPKVLIVNQDLLIAHFKNLEDYRDGILPSKFGMLIIDEIHNLEDKARNFLTFSIDKNFLDKVFKNLDLLYKKLRSVSHRRKEIINLKENLEFFFKEIKSLLIEETKELKDESEADNLFIKKPNGKYKNLSENIEKIITNIQIDLISQYPSINRNLEKESDKIIDDLRIVMNFIESCFDNPSKNIIWGYLNINHSDFKVFYCPDMVSEVLNRFIFNRYFPTVGLSATITVLNENNKESYDYIKTSIGFEGEVVDSKISPFPYEKSRLFIPSELPEYSQRDEFYFETVSKIISDIIENTEGGALALFTSKNDLNEVYKVLVTRTDTPIFKGLKSEQTNSILEKFKKNGGIILGTGSFWEGLDLKGKMLTNLIIVRLPFPVPSPVLKRKEEKTSVNEVYIPEMITKLRQGTGRLIRTKSDVGVCSILDSRMNVDNYRKKIILNSLPFKEIITDYPELKKFQKEKNL